MKTVQEINEHYSHNNGVDDEWLKYVKENPRAIHNYIEYQTLTIQIELKKIELATLDLAYQVGK